MRKIRTNFFYSPRKRETFPSFSNKLKTIRKDSCGTSDFFRKQLLLLVLGTFLLSGVICGVLFARSADYSYLLQLDVLFASNFENRTTQPLNSVFIASFASAFFFLLCDFLFGLSFWGNFIIPIIPFFRGFGLGLTSGYLYAAYEWKGILFYLVVILPGAFLCIFAVLFASKAGMEFSRKLLYFGIFSGKQKQPDLSNLNFKKYIFRFGGYVILSAFASAADMVMAACFAGIFSF